MSIIKGIFFLLIILKPGEALPTVIHESPMELTLFNMRTF